MGLRMEHDHNKCRSIPSQISWLAQPCQSPYIHCRVDNVNLCDHKKRRHTFSKPRRGPFFRHPRCSPCLACARKRVHKSLKCSHDDQTARPRRETGLTSQDVDTIGPTGRLGLTHPQLHYALTLSASNGRSLQHIQRSNRKRPQCSFGSRTTPISLRACTDELLNHHQPPPRHRNSDSVAKAPHLIASFVRSRSITANEFDAALHQNNTL